MTASTSWWSATCRTPTLWSRGSGPRTSSSTAAVEAPPAHSVTLAAKLLSSEFGGRHFDVTVAAGAEEFRLRADAAAHGSWLRTSSAGEPVTVSFRPDQMQVYPLGGAVADRPLVAAS